MNKFYFFTATILRWMHLLSDNRLKDIIIDSLKFLINQRRIQLFAFVIMPNHIHIIWQILEPHLLPEVQRDFLKFTAQQIKGRLINDRNSIIEQFRVNAADRIYQIWERNPLSVELYSDKVIEQKVNYIHLNPIREKWKLSKSIYEYRYSSARYYYDGFDEWGLFEKLTV